MNRRLSVKVSDQTFNIRLLTALSRMGNIIMDLDFECGNKKTQSILDSNKPIIADKMKQELSDHPQEAFNQLFKLKDELKGIKVEVENDDHVFDCLNMTNSEMEERYKQCKGIVSFD